MKNLILSLLLIISLNAHTQMMSEAMRLEFFEMENDTCKAMDFFNQIKAPTYQTPVDQAWAGAMEAAAAPCVKGAFRKLEYFSRGKKNLEEAILADPQNPEIRFLRFATQTQAPSFLEYDNIREDKTLILQFLPQLIQHKQSKAFWREAAKFMLNSGKLSKAETEMVKGLMD